MQYLAWKNEITRMESSFTNFLKATVQSIAYFF